jgi:hypothetical protein
LSWVGYMWAGNKNLTKLLFGQTHENIGDLVGWVY